MKLGKLVVLVLLALILGYTAIIYNSVAMLLPAVSLILIPMGEGLLLLSQRYRIDIGAQLLSSSIQQGQGITVLVNIMNHSRFPLVNLRVVVSRKEAGSEKRYWETLNMSSQQREKIEFSFEAEHCGNQHIVMEGIWLSDWLGWFEMPVRQDRIIMAATVYPPMVPLNTPEIVPVVVEDEEEELEDARRGQARDQILGIREYEPGDRLQEIHWKMSARTGNLVVREYGENVACQCVILLDLPAIAGATAMQQDDCYGKAVGNSLGLLQGGCFHYVVYPVPDLPGITKKLSSGYTQFTLLRQIVRTESQIFEFLQKCYETVTVWQQNGGLPENCQAYGEQWNMRKAELMEAYQLQYEQFPSENFIYIQ